MTEYSNDPTTLEVLYVSVALVIALVFGGYGAMRFSETGQVHPALWTGSIAILLAVVYLQTGWPSVVRRR